MQDKTGAVIHYGPLKTVFSIFSLVAAGLWSAIVSTNAQVNVTQFHNHSSRDGLYIDPAFTQSAATNLARDLNFDGRIVSDVYAQPLYIEGGPNGPMIIAVTESNIVYAVNAVNGTIIWQRNVGATAPANDISCSPVGSTGITGTPVVDLASRALFLDALVTPDGGATIKHYIISLNADTGDINACWPVDVEATACQRPLTIDHTKVPHTQSNFTVLVSVTDPALKTVANGGHVVNANGYDIGFYADSGGTIKLKWEVEKYDGTTGNLIAWVKIPSVSSSTDTVFYLMYGDSSINTDQSDPPNTWDSNFNAVWHLGNDTTLSLIDSISGNSLTNTGTVGATTGIIDGAAGTFNGTSQSLNSPPIDLTSTGHVMLTAWVNTAAFANDDGLFFEFSNNFNLNPGGFLVDPNDRPTSAFVVGLLNNGGHNEGYFTRPSTGWHYYAFTFDFTTQAGALATGAYVDAIAQVLIQNKFDTGSPGHAGNYPFYIMSRGATTLFHQGVVDEVRLSSIFRSPEWITTEFNNQSSPGTFITMGSESCPTTTPTPTPTATPFVTPTPTPPPPTPTPTPPPPTPTPTATTTPTPTATPTPTPPATACQRPLTIDHTKVPSTQSNFTVLVSLTDPALKTIANGGHVANANGYDIGFYSDSGGLLSSSGKWRNTMVQPAT